MFCNNCGKEIADNSKFCPECGSQINSDKVAAAVQDNAEKSNKQSGKSTKIVAAVIGILLVLIVCAVVIVGMIVKKVVNKVNNPEINYETSQIQTDDEETIEESDVTKEAVVKEVMIDDPLMENTDTVFLGDYGRDDYETRNLVTYFLDIENYSPSDVCLVCCSDFEKNGKAAAFIFAGEYNGDDEMNDYYSGKCYYVDDDEVLMIEDTTDGTWRNISTYCDLGGREYYIADEYYVTSAPSHMLTVKNGTLYEDPISRTGNILIHDKDNIELTIDSYDVDYDKEIGFIGHSWKPYYFYYDENRDEIIEYDAKEIDVDTIDEVCGYSISDDINCQDEAYILSAFERENGLLNINYLVNYSDSVVFRNATWNLNTGKYEDAWSDGATENIDESDCGGTFAASAFEGYGRSYDIKTNKRINITIFTTDNFVDLGGDVVIFGHDDSDGLFNGRAVIIDNLTNIRDDAEYYSGYERGMLPIDWIKRIANPSEDDIMMGVTMQGCYDINVSGAYVNVINELGWWD